MTLPKNLFIDDLIDIPNANLSDDDDDKELKYNKSSIKKQFSENFNNLELDISHIDLRLSHIQKFIVSFEGQIEQLKTIIKNTSDPTKKSNLYAVLNNSIELNVRYEEIYIKCLDLKQKYRHNQSDLNYKVIRMIELELSKIKEEEETLSPGRLAQMVNELSAVIHNKSNSLNSITSEELVNDITSIQNDPKYRI
jgi:hypothetical protein